MDVKNPHVIWASVTIVCVMVAGAVILALTGNDVTVILSLAALVAIPVLAGFGAAVYQKLDQVKETSNGTLSRALNDNRVQTERFIEQGRAQTDALMAILRQTHPNISAEIKESEAQRDNDATQAFRVDPEAWRP